MIIRKTPEEIDVIAEAGEIVAGCLAMLRGMCRPGVTTAELDRAGGQVHPGPGGEPAFKGYRGFPASICTSPNSMVVHGIPGAYELAAGDVLSIDVGRRVRGLGGGRRADRRAAAREPDRDPTAEGDAGVAGGGDRACRAGKPAR